MTDLEERTYHAKCHLVIVGYHFLEWVYRNPSLIVGTLFGSVNIGKNELNTDIGIGSTIGLLLGVTAKDVKTEHKAGLISFPQWNLMNIEEEKSVNESRTSEPTENKESFSKRLFKATMDILKQENERRRDQHYRIPSVIHTPSPTSPTYDASQNAHCYNSVSFNSDINLSEPNFKVWPNERDTPSINALQKSLLLLLSHCVNPTKDKIECYFVCLEKRKTNDVCSVNAVHMDSGGSLSTVMPDSSKDRIELEQSKGCDNNLRALLLNDKEPNDPLSLCSIENFQRDIVALPPKRSMSRSSSMSKNIGNDSVKKNSIRLDLKCISSNLVEIIIPKKVYCRLDMFLTSASDNDHDRYIMVELKVNGLSWDGCTPNMQKNIDSTETNGQLVKLETPMSTLERLIETSTLLPESTLSWTNGQCNALSFGLDQNLASVISNEMPNTLFSWILDPKPSDECKKIDNSKVMFPTLIHWAAYKGLDKAIVSLLNLPGATLAAEQLNCTGKSASEMAKEKGYLNIWSLIESKRKKLTDKINAESKCNKVFSKFTAGGKMHDYEYPTVRFSDPGIQNHQDSNNDTNEYIPPLSNISPPPTPPLLSKMYDLKNSYEKYKRSSFPSSSSSGESWTPSTNRSSTVSSGTLETVNNNLYDIPRGFSQPVTIPPDSVSPDKSADAKSGAILTTLPSESVKNDESPDIFKCNHKPDTVATKNENAQGVSDKLIEYSYIPMQPRCNSAGQSSYIAPTTFSEDETSQCSSAYNSMGRRKKSNSSSCILPKNRKSSLPIGEKSNSDDTNNKRSDGFSCDINLKSNKIPPKHFLETLSSPRPRHEFMKTFCNFSNQEALLNDDYSPYTEKCDVKSLHEDTTPFKSLENKNVKEISCSSDTEPNPTPQLAMGFTPTLITKIRKPIEKSESIAWPPKLSKRKGVKKV